MHLRHSGHTVLLDTGNPIEPPPDPRPDRASGARAWQLPPHVGTVVLIFGGSQGARALNQAVDAWLDRPLPDGLGVIWATGASAFDTYARRDPTLCVCVRICRRSLMHTPPATSCSPGRAR